MKNIEKITKYFTNVLLGIVIIAIFFALYSFIQLVILEKDYVNYFGYTLFEVQSGSMSPTINVDDMLLVKLTTDIKKGDIITYKNEENFITHRVIEANGDKIITKGDSNNSEDKRINKDAVLGKIVKIFPKFGKWKKILLSPGVLIALFSTLTIFSLGLSYNDKKKEKEKPKKQDSKNKKTKSENKSSKKESEKNNDKKNQKEKEKNNIKDNKEKVEVLNLDEEEIL